MLDVDDKMLKLLESADFEGFVKIGVEYADAVICAENPNSESMNALIKTLEKNKKMNSFSEIENHFDAYFELYNELAN
jgi:starch synthase